MKTKTLKRRGISPLIATIILIAITVAGGLLVYSAFFSTAGVLSAKGQVAVENMKLVKPTTGKGNFTITIKNTGNKPVQELNVTLDGEEKATVTLPGNALQPGQSVYYSPQADLAKEYVIGNLYTVIVSAEFSDGSTFSDAFTVMCTSA
jgi:flagellin-like protein